MTTPGKLVLGLLSLSLSAHAQTYSATYLPSNAPDHSEEGQSGTNRCGTGFNQSSNCQNAYVNSITDWCVWAPPKPGADSVIGNTEVKLQEKAFGCMSADLIASHPDQQRIEVAWCTKSGTGARLIPDGAITGAHFVQTPDFVQVTGVGNLTFINVPAGDAGGELDPHGQDGLGNPIGGLVFSTAFGQLQEIFEWTNFISDTEFCIRACKRGPMAHTWCQHIYDEMGCAWNMPANYDPGTFESCKGDSGEPMGIYGASTFHQGEPVTPAAHPVPSSSLCTTVTSIANGVVATGTSTSASSITSVGTANSLVTPAPLSSSSSATIGVSSSSSALISAQDATTGRPLAPASSGASPAATNAARSHMTSFDHLDRGVLLLALIGVNWMIGFVGSPVL